MKTLSELLQLSQAPEGIQKLRIMLAELVGWTFTPFKADGSGYDDVAVLPPGVNFEDEGAVWRYAGTSCPNYPLDLNACAEVENSLDFKQSHENEMTMVGMMYGEGAPMYATALQRTIALILTLQKPESRPSPSDLLELLSKTPH